MTRVMTVIMLISLAVSPCGVLCLVREGRDWHRRGMARVRRMGD